MTSSLKRFYRQLNFILNACIWRLYDLSIEYATCIRPANIRFRQLCVDTASIYGDSTILYVEIDQSTCLSGRLPRSTQQSRYLGHRRVDTTAEAKQRCADLQRTRSAICWYIVSC